MEQKQLGIIELQGATCTSCAIAIEHMGKRLPGVSQIEIDKRENTVQVVYDGNMQSLEQICSFVHSIGYSATIRQ